MSKKLKGWKMKHLSFAGRHVLAQSVLSAIPLYGMQTKLVPMGVCNQMDKMIRNFLWDGDGTSKKCSLVIWEEVIKSKGNGGLGMRGMHDMNIALLAKLGWRPIHENQSLWSKVIREKYMGPNLCFSDMQVKQGASLAWRGIMKAKQLLVDGSRIFIRNGKNTRFSDDCWLYTWVLTYEFPLCTITHVEIDDRDLRKTVADYWEIDKIE